MPEADAIVLDLSELPRLIAELDPRLVEAVALAASVVLDAIHGTQTTIPARLTMATTSRAVQLRPGAVDDRARRTYGDWQEAVEEGGEAVALLGVARRAFDRIPFRRLAKRTGADYFLRDPEAKDASDAYERLECSGIASEHEQLDARLRSKLAQFARFPDLPAGYAVATHFGNRPVAIGVGRWPS